MPVEYLGGLAGHQGAPKKGATCTLIGDADGLHIHRWNTPALDKPGWIPVVTFAWPEVRRIEVASTKVSRLNVAAIAVFGALGLAATRPPGTHIAVSAGTTDALFLSEDPAAKLRPLMERLVPDEHRSRVLRFEGVPPHEAAEARSPLDPGERLARLSQLHAEGLVTDDELAARRAAILAEL